MQLSLELNTSELWRMLPYQIPCDTAMTVIRELPLACREPCRLSKYTHTINLFVMNYNYFLFIVYLCCFWLMYLLFLYTFFVPFWFSYI